MNVKARFSSAASTYEESVTVLDDLAKDLLDMLPPGFASARILEPGCGTGVLTRRLAACFPAATIDAFDLSSDMIDMARRLSRNLGKVSWRVADFQDAFTPPGSHDAVISSAALHWARSRPAAFASLDARLASGGRFHSALMLKGTLGEIHASRAVVAPRKPTLAALPEFSEIMHELEQTGWSCEHAEERSYVAVHADAQQALRNLHEQGVTGGSYSRSVAPLTRTELRGLIAYYDQAFALNGGVSVTYNVGFFSFRKS